MKGLGRTASGALANLIGQGLPFLLLLFVTPILLDALGRERYGALVLFSLVPQIAGQLDLGLVSAATRGFAQHSARADHPGARRLFREALFLLAAWGALLACLFYLFHQPIAATLKLDATIGEHDPIYIASALSITLALINAATLVPLRALEQYGRAARIQLSGGVAYWFVCALWAPRGATVTELVTLGVVAVSLTTIALYVATRTKAFVASGNEARDYIEVSAAAAASVDSQSSGLLLRPFLSVGAGAFIAQASSLATYHADKLLVSALISPAAAGAYAICTNIANKILLVIAAGATYTFPRATRMHSEGNLDAVTSTFVTASRLSMLIAVAVAVPLIALAQSFLSVWIGPAFANDHGLTLQLLALGYAIASSSVVASNVAIGIGESRAPAAFAITGGATTIVAVLLLAPRYGAPGAAAAAVIGMTQALVFNGLVARRLGSGAHEASWPLVWRLILVGLPVGLATAAASIAVRGWISLIALALASSTVFLLLWLSTFGRRQERRLLTHMLNRAKHV